MSILFTWILSSVSLFAATNSQPVGLKVMSENPAVAKQFEKALRKAIANEPHLKIKDDTVPVRQLWVYIVKTVNSSKNPDGYAISILHTKPILAVDAIKKLDDLCTRAKCKEKEQTEVAKLSAALLQFEPLAHLNVADLDELTEPKLETLINSIVKDFRERVE